MMKNSKSIYLVIKNISALKRNILSDLTILQETHVVSDKMQMSHLP